MGLPVEKEGVKGIKAWFHVREGTGCGGRSESGRRGWWLGEVAITEEKEHEWEEEGRWVVGLPAWVEGKARKKPVGVKAVSKGVMVVV